jgi:uncharacterized zinc-type alcohol dehydrogenase-like protein
MLPTKGYAQLEKGGRLQPWKFERRNPRPDDVSIKILYSGVCHSDIHALKDGWGQEIPLVPGHEIMGEVTNLGSNVKDFERGDHVLIGTMVDSCRVCQQCKTEMESYCRQSPTYTYDSLDRVDHTRTRGGYSDTYVADQRFVYHLPKGMNGAAAAPLVCAGITTYSPLRHWNIGPGHTVAVIGIGGLGHLGVKFARAMGAHVVAFTVSPDKVKEAKRLRAHEVVISTDSKAMQAQAGRFDFILDTVSGKHNLDPYLMALKMDGTLCSLGIPNSMQFTPAFIAMSRLSIASSASGGTRETREMLEFCAKHHVAADIELVKMSEINEVLERLGKSDVKYRFVIDMTNGF